ncbi:MAG: hypothetical protein WCS01_17015 [bacterium]
MPFGFRIMPLVADLSDFVVVIRAGEETVVDEPEWEPDLGEEVDTPIAFRPPKGFSGVNVFKIYVGYRKGEEYRWYTKVVTHEVFRAQEPAGKVLETLRIQIINNPTAREAGDAPVNNYIQGLDSLIKGAQGSIEDFKAFNPPPIWAPLVLLK